MTTQVNINNTEPESLTIREIVEKYGYCYFFGTLNREYKNKLFLICYEDMLILAENPMATWSNPMGFNVENFRLVKNLNITAE